MWNLKQDTEELIHETAIDSQTQRSDRGREWSGSLGLAYANYYIEKGETTGLTVEHRELYSMPCDKP